MIFSVLSHSVFLPSWGYIFCLAIIWNCLILSFVFLPMISFLFQFNPHSNRLPSHPHFPQFSFTGSQNLIRRANAQSLLAVGKSKRKTLFSKPVTWAAACHFMKASSPVPHPVCLCSLHVYIPEEKCLQPLHPSHPHPTSTEKSADQSEGGGSEGLRHWAARVPHMRACDSVHVCTYISV